MPFYSNYFKISLKDIFEVLELYISFFAVIKIHFYLRYSIIYRYSIHKKYMILYKFQKASIYIRWPGVIQWPEKFGWGYSGRQCGDFSSNSPWIPELHHIHRNVPFILFFTRMSLIIEIFIELPPVLLISFITQNILDEIKKFFCIKISIKFWKEITFWIEKCQYLHSLFLDWYFD